MRGEPGGPGLPSVGASAAHGTRCTITATEPWLRIDEHVDQLRLRGQVVGRHNTAAGSSPRLLTREARVTHGPFRHCVRLTIQICERPALNVDTVAGWVRPTKRGVDGEHRCVNLRDTAMRLRDRVLKRWLGASDVLEADGAQTIGGHAVAIPSRPHDARVDRHAVPEGDILWVKVGAPHGEAVVARVLEVSVAHLSVAHVSVEVDAVCLVGARNDVAHDQVLRALHVARRRHPHAYLSGANAVWDTEAAFLARLPAAVIVTTDRGPHLGRVLRKVVIIESHILDCHVN
mmetsp:Transcript_56488/g.112155  ORF Transcript_56488/g.112155 Transcript_56488/m.112155 type:complete len:289 (-) Transcript_56488:358-1224(-)